MYADDVEVMVREKVQNPEALFVELDAKDEVVRTRTTGLLRVGPS